MQRRFTTPFFAAALLYGVAVAQTTPAAPAATNDNDITRSELRNWDRFLDSHQAIDKEVTKNPSLLRNANYLATHPELDEFLKEHPGVREEALENPKVFMHREARFEQRGGDINGTELRNFDEFLDRHPEMDKQISQNPKLLRDPSYLTTHPDLDQFLKNHPGVREEALENPKVFMNREQRFEGSGRDITRGEAARFDQFLDKHPEIAKDLRANPKLVDDKQYVANHPELGEFLQSHPEVRRDIRQHPNAFMKREAKFEKWEDKHGGEAAGRKAARRR